MSTASIKIGDIEVWSILDGQFRFAEPAGFPPKDSPDFAVHSDYITPDGTWLMDIGVFVVRTGDRVLMVDAGAGSSDGKIFAPPRFSSIEDVDPVVVAYFRDRGLVDDSAILQSLQVLSRTDVRHGDLAANLAATGLRPEDITDVVLTHLHYDHIGWVSDEGRPFFPNATIRCERQDADFFLSPEHDDSFYRWLSNAMPTGERMAPILDRLEMWDRDASIAPGVDALFAPGHTPGSCLIALSSGAQRALLLGDAVHCPLELTDPEFAALTDMDQAVADRTREMIRREMEDGHTVSSAPHFSGLRFGRLLSGTGPRRWSFEWR
jgi:glyoxylase-like metal-dependent hydrolase (beta-lactamase superfamily II)